MNAKRYHFNAYNADETLINKISVVCTSLEVARNKASLKLSHIYGEAACFIRLNFNYHEPLNRG